MPPTDFLLAPTNDRDLSPMVAGRGGILPNSTMCCGNSGTASLVDSTHFRSRRRPPIERDSSREPPSATKSAILCMGCGPSQPGIAAHVQSDALIRCHLFNLYTSFCTACLGSIFSSRSQTHEACVTVRASPLCLCTTQRAAASLYGRRAQCGERKDPCRRAPAAERRGLSAFSP